MKSIKEKQFLVNMAIALGQTPDPALVKEINEHKELMDSITPRGDEFGGFLAQLAQLKDEVETVKQVVEVKKQYFKPEDIPKPPTLEELMAIVPEEVFEPVVEEVKEEPVEEEVKEEVNPLIAAASEHITKEVQMEAVSFQQPDTDPMSRTLDDLRKKITQLENWISRIAATGPGSGEVNLLKLDDVDISAIGDNKYLRYNAANAKIEFATVSGGGGGTVDSVNGLTGTVVLTTANIAEVSSNLYFTDERVVNALTPGTGIDIAANGLISSTVSGGGGSANLLAVTTAIIPVADSVQDLGTANLRWGTLYLANNTIDLGGSLISSDGTGTITISSQGAVLPVNSKVAVDGVDKNIALVGNTGAIATVVPFYTEELGLNTTATNFTFGANPDDYVFTNFIFNNGTTITQSARALFYF